MELAIFPLKKPFRTPKNANSQNSMAAAAALIFYSLALTLSPWLVAAGFISAVHSDASSPINVWPKPRIFSWPRPQAILISATNFTINSPYHPHLTCAVRRYRRRILTERHRPLIPPAVYLARAPPFLETLTLSVADLGAPLHPGANESYTLRIPAGGAAAEISAATPWGAMRGLETFSQLVWGDPVRAAAGLEVEDWPIFEHRGVLLDTSRNFYPVEDILRTIGAMSQNKMNVFHWHITDSQSFPMLLPTATDLAEKGAYGPDMVYSPADVHRIVEFGLQRGVRVLPEIDVPGHTGSWAEAHPEIVTCANMFWWPIGSDWPDRLASQPGTGQLNPLEPKTYQVLKSVIRGAVSLFPDPFYHAGSDEVIPGCWTADPTIRSFLSSGGTLDQLLEIFINSTLPYILSLNRTAVFWEDILLDDRVKVPASILPKESVVLQTWNGGPERTKRIVQSGFHAIVSSSDYYYLDCGNGGYLGNDSQYNMRPGSEQGNGGSWCAPFKTWQTIYNYDITHGLSEEEARLVLGGEVALWSEQADPTVLDSRIWPRASAAAEALWSGNRDEATGKKRFAEATDRLNEWRHRMVCRGIRAEPIQPLWCIKNPGMCNTVHSS